MPSRRTEKRENTCNKESFPFIRSSIVTRSVWSMAEPMGSVVKDKLRDETRSILLFAIYTFYAYILYISIFDRPFLTPLQDKHSNETATATDPPDYGNSAATVTLIVLASLALGRATEWASLPSLLGMLLAGIALRNLPLSILSPLTVPREWATVLRRASFVVILLRGALSLDGESLKRTKGACLRLSLLPCTLEAIVIAGVSVLIFDISILFGLLLGFLLAAASPAVVVPSIIKVAQEGYGTHLSSMIIASCSLDDVYNISMFSVLLSILFSTGDSLFLTLIRAPIQVVAGCLLGGLIGYLGRFAPTASRFSLLLSTSMTVYFGCVYAHIDSCGTLAVLVAAFLAVSEWRKKEPDCNSEQAKLRTMWELLFQPLLFGLIGFDLQLSTLTWRLVLLGCAVLAIGVAVRTIVAFFAVMGAGLTTRERAFVALAWPSKATVQAALATAAIDLVDKGGYGEEYRNAAVIVFSLAVLSILTTAPLGAILIRISAPLLLTKETKDDQRF